MFWIIKKGIKVLDIDDVKYTIEKIYNNENVHKAIMYPNGNYVMVKLKDINGNHITKAKVAYNIKHKNTLGYHCDSVNISIYAFDKVRLTLSKGYTTNKPIRPLFSI